MRRSHVIYAAMLLIVYFTLTFCADNQNVKVEESKNQAALKEANELLEVEGRTRKRYKFYHHLWGWHALAIAYWIKVKVVVVAIIVGSAIFWGLRYFWPHKCTPELVYDRVPPSLHHHHGHDHIPYSLEDSAYIVHTGPFEPYAAYSGYSSNDIITDDSATISPTEIHRGRRNVENIDKGSEELKEGISKNSQSTSRQISTEEQIADFVFMFLGLDSSACRRRFICEMEFHTNRNPISSMAFRIIGRAFFEKYTNVLNPKGRAKSFHECAAVNPQCVFIENNQDLEQGIVHDDKTADLNYISSSEVTEFNLENENLKNLNSEKRQSKLLRGKGQLNTVAEHILQYNQNDELAWQAYVKQN